jgi:hypothetical protein
MLKINASYSKKVPAEQDYSSKSFHASVEAELSDTLSPEELKRKIHETFAVVKEAVESEINFSPKLGRGSNDEPASSRQLAYLTDIARRTNADLDSHLRRYRVSRIEDLSRQQCSNLIDELQKGHKAA